MRQQVERATNNTQFTQPTVKRSLYLRIRERRSFGDMMVVAGPFNTVAEREKFKRDFCCGVASLGRELNVNPDAPFELKFTDFDTIGKPQGLVSDSASECLARMKTCYLTSHPEPQTLS